MFTQEHLGGRNGPRIVGSVSEILSDDFLVSGIRAYEQLGFRAFGTPGKMAAGIAITLQNIGGESVNPIISHWT